MLPILHITLSLERQTIQYMIGTCRTIQYIHNNQLVVIGETQCTPVSVSTRYFLCLTEITEVPPIFTWSPQSKHNAMRDFALSMSKTARGVRVIYSSL